MRFLKALFPKDTTAALKPFFKGYQCENFGNFSVITPKFRKSAIDIAATNTLSTRPFTNMEGRSLTRKADTPAGRRSCQLRYFQAEAEPEPARRSGGGIRASRLLSSLPCAAVSTPPNWSKIATPPWMSGHIGFAAKALCTSGKTLMPSKLNVTMRESASAIGAG